MTSRRRPSVIPSASSTHWRVHLVSVGYRLDRYTLFDIPDTASRAYKEYEGKNLSSVVSTGITYDSTTRANVLRPVWWAASLWNTAAAVSAVTTTSSSLSVNCSRSTPCFATRTTSSIGVAASAACSKTPTSRSPVFDRFFIGGIDSIRGYDSEDLAPRDPKYHDEIGGDRMGFLNFEYIWTFHPEMGIALVPFFDIGYNIDSSRLPIPSAT